jgi:mono/diheme cytochrome c family protein
LKLLVVPALVVLSGCVQEMADQPRWDAWEAAPAALLDDDCRAPVAGTVARGELRLDAHLSQGRQNEKPATTFPFAIDERQLARGRERFEIFCTPCHGFAGHADGSVVERGFPQPPTYHSERLRNAPPGHLFDVISNGIGRMPRFSDRIVPRDRWAIAAYIRALQFSQHVSLDELSEQQRTQILDELP